MDGLVWLGGRLSGLGAFVDGWCVVLGGRLAGLVCM